MHPVVASHIDKRRQTKWQKIADIDFGLSVTYLGGPGVNAYHEVQMQLVQYLPRWGKITAHASHSSLPNSPPTFLPNIPEKSLKHLLLCD